MKTPKPNRALLAIAYLLIFVPVVVIVFFSPAAHEFFGIDPKLFMWIMFFPMVTGFILQRLALRHLRNERTAISIRKVKHLLFPPAVKWIGFGIALAGIVLLIVLRDPRMWSVVIAGLWIAMWSRDGLEDEMLREVRLSTAWFALSFVALYVAFLNIMPDVRLSAVNVVFVVMLYYHIVLWTFKWRISREKHD
jgi:hypothetical protein